MGTPAWSQPHRWTLHGLVAVLCGIGLLAGAPASGVARANATVTAKAAKKSAPTVRCKGRTARSTRRGRARVTRCERASSRRRARAVKRRALVPAVPLPASGVPAASSPPSAPAPARPRPPVAPPAPAPPPPPSPSAAPQPPPAGGLRIGLTVDSQGWGSQMGARQDSVASSGVKWLREQFDWRVIEPARGRWDWSRYDQLELTAAQRGFTVLPVLMSTPAWAGATWNTIPSDPTDYAELTAKVTARYGPGGTFWAGHPELASKAPAYFELWNEPYYPQFSDNRIDPGRYARMVKAAALAGRTANVQARFVMASETDVLPTGSSDWVSWTDAMYAAVPDLNSYFDAVAVHPYSKAFAPDAPANGYVHDKFARTSNIHDDFGRHGATNKPFWITEIGWSTCSDAAYCVSEATQAAYTSKLFALLRSTYTYVDAVFLYRASDLGPAGSSDPEQDFGLTHEDGSAKPAWNVLKAATGAA